MLAAPALLSSLLLAACSGTPTVSPLASDPVTLQAQATTSGYAKIIRVKIGAADTQASLAAAYPGSQLLTFHAEELYATLAVNTYKTSAAVLSEEANVRLKLGEANAQGVLAWSGGNNAWSGGYTVWTGTGAGLANSFPDNQALWSVIQLSGGQTRAPSLGRGVTVAVIDTGIDVNHPAFAGRLNLSRARDYVDGDTSPAEVNGGATGASAGYGHGTAVAGIITQIAPNATILPLRVLGPDGSGDLASVIQAIDYAAGAGAKVINLSLGSVAASKALTAAITTAGKAEALVMASVGNSGDANVTHPAATASSFNAAMSVASVTTRKTRSAFSAFGAVEISAPGEQIRTAFPEARTVQATGTSFATPILSGVAALGLSATTKAASGLPGLIMNSASPNLSSDLGAGTVNADAFLALAAK